MVTPATASSGAVRRAWVSRTGEAGLEERGCSSPSWLLDGNSKYQQRQPLKTMARKRLPPRAGKRGAPVLPASGASPRGSSQDPADCRSSAHTGLRQQPSCCRHGEGRKDQALEACGSPSGPHVMENPHAPAGTVVGEASLQQLSLSWHCAPAPRLLGAGTRRTEMAGPEGQAFVL